MNGRADVQSALDTIERLVADAVRRAADLERAIGVTITLGGDTAAGDNALMATYRAIGVYTQRRTRLLTILANYPEPGGTR